MNKKIVLTNHVPTPAWRAPGSHHNKHSNADGLNISTFISGVDKLHHATTDAHTDAHTHTHRTQLHIRTNYNFIHYTQLWCAVVYIEVPRRRV
ncbi:hypothetical protein BgiMline_017492 [Biomphalaria glabrata]|nr:hypothetical protein BgiMline_005153 [Biomphalaria glabrata]